MGNKEVQKIVDALWATSILVRPYEDMKSFSAPKMIDGNPTTVFIGKIYARTYSENLFLLRVEREGENPTDSVFFSRDEWNQACVKVVQEFSAKESKLNAEFDAWREGEKKKWEREFKGKICKFEKQTPWGTLEIKTDRELSWETPATVRAGSKEFPADCFARVLKEATERLMIRMECGAKHGEYFDLSSLFEAHVESTRHYEGNQIISETIAVSIDLPEQARKTIEERRRVAGIRA
jgi:hypothetical protein